MISTALNPTQSVWNALIPLWQTISTFFLWQSMWKLVYAVQIERRDCPKLLTNGQHPLYFLAEEIPGFIYIRFDHQVNTRGKNTDEFDNSMIDNKDGHVPSPLIMFTCTALHHALLKWQKNKAVHPKASQSKLQADRPDHSNNVNYKTDGGKIASCWAATSR